MFATLNGWRPDYRDFLSLRDVLFSQLEKKMSDIMSDIKILELPYQGL